ncbi:beta-1,4-galactosyltransferase 7-like [Mya arenaria]|uniref:beta-1,4-galactosyltransferase 7-like n=1 Tax=Mya arenaria TaxID=6604 RepID=UPI0022DF3D99|nr:beta-1,4-galactosyltransferase 7-like [Mya arenaria]
MARKISLLKCLLVVGMLYLITLTMMLFWCSPTTLLPTKIDDEHHSVLERLIVPNLTDVVDYLIKNQSLVLESYLLKNKENISLEKNDNQNWGPHKLAIIVPFRERFEELMEFAPYLHQYLLKQHVRHEIYVINQIDTLRFNRGSLINIGALESSLDCDYIAMHDVDLLPVSEELDYSFPGNGPYHIASPELHPLYHYPTFIGGILLITKKHFSQVNGMSNRYYGWGREDDEFYVRLKKGGLLVTKSKIVNGTAENYLEIRRPKNISTGRKTFRHIHDRVKRVRDSANLFNQKEQTNRMDRETGVHTVKYEVKARNSLSINRAPVTLLEVKLSCDFLRTPWCLKKEDHHLLDTVVTPPKSGMKRQG